MIDIAKNFKMTLGDTFIQTLGTIDNIDTLEFAKQVIQLEIDHLKEVKKMVDTTKHKEEEKQ